MEMRVAIIDADLIGRKRHRFPNLACMKLSGFHKECGDEVSLKTDYDDLGSYDKVYISKVFTDTKVPDAVLKLANVSFGGTGFYYDKAPALLDEAEHHMPDYHLYDEWVAEQIASGKKRSEFSYYTTATYAQLPWEFHVWESVVSSAWLYLLIKNPDVLFPKTLRQVYYMARITNIKRGES